MIFKLKLTFGPKWENIAKIRTFISDILASGIVKEQEAKMVATAVSELVENLVKYSALGGASISVLKDPGEGKVILVISNIASADNLKTFETVFNEVNMGEPKDAYKKMMLKSISGSGLSQLGLARIRYECQGKLSYVVEDDVEPITEITGINTVDSNFKLLTITVVIPVDFSETN